MIVCWVRGKIKRIIGDKDYSDYDTQPGRHLEEQEKIRCSINNLHMDSMLSYGAHQSRGWLKESEEEVLSAQVSVLKVWRVGAVGVPGTIHLVAVFFLYSGHMVVLTCPGALLGR